MGTFLRTGVGLALLLAAINLRAQAEDDSVLAQCRAQSQNLDAVHACLDGYLDVMDGNIDAITGFLDESLSGESRVGLQLSQQAFINYRRENCLWYLNFSSPRSEAEQIAKQCLVDMSNRRLQELRTLVSVENTSIKPLQGFYVYGAQRNSFQPCGTEERYWVEGASDVVGLIQQTYLSVATGERQLLHVSVVGNVDTQAQVPEGHSGVFALSHLIELRVPTDSDCRLTNRPGNLDISGDEVSVPELSLEVADDEREQDEEPEQQLTAIFGEWVVNCLELARRKSCSLDVSLLSANANASANQEPVLPTLTLHRSARESSYMELYFPQREIDSPTLIRWSVDSRAFGDILGSAIRVDQTGTRELISENSFLTDELVPSMVDGLELKVEVLNTVDDTSGEVFLGTLRGLTKALAFADDFVGEQNQ